MWGLLGYPQGDVLDGGLAEFPVGFSCFGGFGWRCQECRRRPSNVLSCVKPDPAAGRQGFLLESEEVGAVPTTGPSHQHLQLPRAVLGRAEPRALHGGDSDLVEKFSFPSLPTPGRGQLSLPGFAVSVTQGGRGHAAAGARWLLLLSFPSAVPRSLIWGKEH